MENYPDELIKPLIPFVSLVNIEHLHPEMIRIFKTVSPVSMCYASFQNEEKLTKKVFYLFILEKDIFWRI